MLRKERESNRAREYLLVLEIRSGAVRIGLHVIGHRRHAQPAHHRHIQILCFPFWSADGHPSSPGARIWVSDRDTVMRNSVPSASRLLSVYVGRGVGLDLHLDSVHIERTRLRRGPVRLHIHPYIVRAVMPSGCVYPCPAVGQQIHILRECLRPPQARDDPDPHPSGPAHIRADRDRVIHIRQVAHPVIGALVQRAPIRHHLQGRNSKPRACQCACKR